LDVVLNEGINAAGMHEFLIHLIGVLETGYFLNVADQAIIGTTNGVKIKNKASLID
ncbi:ribose-5-phosphate isomerase, partial [Staphylococcus epidermidis]